MRVFALICAVLFSLLPATPSAFAGAGSEPDAAAVMGQAWDILQAARKIQCEANSTGELQLTQSLIKSELGPVIPELKSDGIVSIDPFAESSATIVVPFEEQQFTIQITKAVVSLGSALITASFHGAPCEKGTLYTTTLYHSLRFNETYDEVRGCAMEEQGLTIPISDSTLRIPLQALPKIENVILPGKKRSMGHKLVLFLPRLGRDLGRDIVHSGVVSRFTNLGVGFYHLVDFGERSNTSKGMHDLSESLLNPLGTAQQATSDILGIVKLPFENGANWSSRIEVCTSNLAATHSPDKNKLPFQLLQAVNPIVHIGVLIDGDEKITEPDIDGLADARRFAPLYCARAPILNGDTESIAIERLSCVADHYESEAKYSFLTYNCGGFTRDVLKYAGIGFPKFPNLGIGNEIPITVKPGIYKKNAQAREKILSAASAGCDMRIKRIQELDAELESKQGISKSTVKYFSDFDVTSLTPDIQLQLMASAARSEDRGKMQFAGAIAIGLGTGMYAKAGPRYRTLFRKIFSGIPSDSAGAKWIEKEYPSVYGLWQQAEKPQ